MFYCVLLCFLLCFAIFSVFYHILLCYTVFYYVLLCSTVVPLIPGFGGVANGQSSSGESH